MLHHRPLRALLCLTLLSVLPLVAHAQEPWRAEAQVFLQDPAIVPLTLAANARLSGAPPGWPTDARGVRCPEDGYLVVDKAGEHLIGYAAPAPKPPVPADEITAAQAEEVARAFLARRLPELTAPGGEVSVSVEAAISKLGARVLHFQRTQSGAKLPTWADVGVRVYDSKVVSYRGSHEAVSCEVAPTVTADKAKEIAGQNLPGNSLEPVLWLEQTQEIATVGGAQRCVWTLSAELKTRNTANKWELEFLYRWRIDAASGEALAGEYLPIDRPRYEWYVAKGGTHRKDGVSAASQNLFEDSSPRFSPDGTQVLFQSTRPREGYPVWSERSLGLYVINADGTGLRCLVPGVSMGPRWSADGKKVSYRDGSDGVVVLDVASGEKVRLRPDPTWTYSWTAWMPDGKLVVSASKLAAEFKLLLLDPANPSAPPVAVPAFLPVATEPAGLAVDGRGRLLVVTWTNARMVPPADPKRGSSPYSVVALTPPLDVAKPEKVLEYLNPYRGLGPGPEGKLLIDVGGIMPAMGGRPGWSLLDPAAGTATTWKLPRLQLPTGTPSQTVDGVTFSPDAKTMAVVAYRPPGKPGEAGSRLIYLLNPDGSNCRALTPPPEAETATTTAAR